MITAFPPPRQWGANVAAPHPLPERISSVTMNTIMRFYTFLLLFLLPLAGHNQANSSTNYLPSALLLLDGHFSHHILVAEKSTHTLHLYRNDNGLPRLLKSYKMATGKKPGNKIFQGDHRTPEGIYFFTEFLSRRKLLERYGKEGEIYGVGAFVTDYPNPIDRLDKKTGYGIWLHSTNDENRIEKRLDSRGCVVTANKHLIEISSYIELDRTMILIVQNLSYLDKALWLRVRNDLQTTLQKWLTAWQNKNTKEYFSHYHKNFFDPQRGNLAQFKAYKKNVFHRPGKPKINISHTNITQHDKYAAITFIQDYDSGVVKDVGRKTLYLMKDEYYAWKIVAEKWTKRGISPDRTYATFQPEVRFFETTNPEKILKQSKN